jgi:PIN domain nuclease of toxin-antitoxin system
MYEFTTYETNLIHATKVVSIWELQIKKSLGKIILPENFIIELQQSGYEILNISANHILMLEKLPIFHRDPFDRMLIAQSLYEKIPLLTKDTEVLKYDFEAIRF